MKWYVSFGLFGGISTIYLGIGWKRCREVVETKPYEHMKVFVVSRSSMAHHM